MNAGPPPVSAPPVHADWQDAFEVLDGLLALEAHLAEGGDRRAIFCSAYVAMTYELVRSLDRGRYADEAWVHAFTACFANYYRRAFLGWDLEQQGNLTPAWETAFRAAADDLPVLHHLLLGMIAHILDDLPLALADTLPRAAPAAREDYLQIMRVVDTAIDPIQDRIALRYAPGLALLDRVALRFDEWATSAGIWVHRRVALWEAAALDAAGPRRPDVRKKIEARALAAMWLVHHAPPSRRVRRAFGRFEQWPVLDWPLLGRVIHHRMRQRPQAGSAPKS